MSDNPAEYNQYPFTRAERTHVEDEVEVPLLIQLGLTPRHGFSRTDLSREVRRPCEVRVDRKGDPVGFIIQGLGSYFIVETFGQKVLVDPQGQTHYFPTKKIFQDFIDELTVDEGGQKKPMRLLYDK